FELLNHNIFAFSPFSFIPSETAISHELTTMLPYLEVHLTVFAPVCPSRFMPRGNCHKFAGISIEKSILRAVTIVPFGPLYTTLVQASALVEMVSITIAMIAGNAFFKKNCFISSLFWLWLFFSWCCHCMAANVSGLGVSGGN